MRKVPTLLVVCVLVALSGWGLRERTSRRAAVGRVPSQSVSAVRQIHISVSDGDAPISGARVRLPATAIAGLTDSRGRCTLEVPVDGELPHQVSVSAAGYLIGGAAIHGDHFSVQLRRLPAKDAPDYEWVDPRPDVNHSDSCGSCHGDLFSQWAGGAHARAAQNRRFRNLYDGSDWDGRAGHGWSLLDEYPHGAAVCASCHAPSLKTSDAAVSDLRRVDGVAALGVHCDYCHKVRDVDLTNVGYTHGRDAMQLLRPAEGQLFFGPLDDVARDEDVYSPLHQESRFCAACHEGVVFGVHVYSTYSEWLQSDARRHGHSCQACHMTNHTGLTNVAPGAGGLQRDPSTLAGHDLMPGGHRAMLRRCLKLDVELNRIDDVVRCGLTLRVSGVGHHVPTGFIDRHLVLHVVATDSKGRTLPTVEAPRLPPAAGELAGDPGQIFGRLLTDADGNCPAPFWRSIVHEVDTRLRPGEARRSEFVLPHETKEVRVRLIYRSFWPQVAREKAWPDDSILVHDVRYAIE